MNVPTGRRRVKVFLARHGAESDIYVKKSGGQDALNHSQDVFDYLDTEYVFKHFKKRSQGISEANDFAGGDMLIERPVFVFAFDSVLEDNCYIIYEGEEYEIEEFTDRDSHFIANGKRVNTDGSFQDNIRDSK